MLALREHSANSVGIQPLLGDYYHIKTIATGLTKATRIILRGGSIYYQNRDGSAQRSYKLIKGKGQFINDPAINYFSEVFHFDSALVDYGNAQNLKLNETVIRTPYPYTKYKVAHHMEKRVFFIVPEHDQATCAGSLYCADVSSPRAEAMAILVTSDVIKDIAIDQYTGNFFILDNTGNIKCFKKKNYYADVNTFISHYTLGGVSSNSNDNVNDDVILIH